MKWIARMETSDTPHGPFTGSLWEAIDALAAAVGARRISAKRLPQDRAVVGRLDGAAFAILPVEETN